MTDELTSELGKLAKTTQSTSDSLGDRQIGNINLIESNIMEKIKASHQQLDKLESVVGERADQIRGKISDLTNIANTVLNATESLTSTIDVMLQHELKPL